MQLTDAQIAEFQQLYKEQFGKDISRQEQDEVKIELLMFILYTPIALYRSKGWDSRTQIGTRE
jgi:hypothetical protein